MNEEHKRRIDQINEWVRLYKEEGKNNQYMDNLLEQFKPFLLKQCNKLNKLYSGVHPWDSIVHEANIIFHDLVGEYTIGGDAYFNVFIQKKLPLRLRYFFVKEIRRRQKHLSHSEEQFLDQGLIGGYSDTDDIIMGMDNINKFSDVMSAISSDVITDRERDMMLSNIMSGESHESIANRYDISRSRVSRIIKGAIEKIQLEVRYRE